MDEAGNGSAKQAVHAELSSSTEKVKASSLLRELPRKLELPISLNISQPFRRHRWPWPWHREPCPALSYHSQRRSLWCPTPSWPLSLRWSKRRCSCRLSCRQHAASWSQPCYACSSTSLSVWNLLQSSLCCPWRPRPLPTFLEQSCSLPSSSSLELSSRWSFSLPSCSSSRTSSWEGPCWLKREGIDEIEGSTSCKRAGAPKSRNMRDQSAFTSWYTMPVCFTSFSQHVARCVARCCTTCRISTYHLISCLSRNKTSLSCETRNFLLKKNYADFYVSSCLNWQDFLWKSSWRLHSRKCCWNDKVIGKIEYKSCKGNTQKTTDLECSISGFLPAQSPHTMDEAGNGSAKRAVHAELSSSTEKVKASSLLRELPRKLELPISLNISQPFRRHRWPWPWHREPCPALSYHSQRRSLWCPTPSWPLSLRWSKRRCSCRLSCRQHAASWSQPCYACSSTSLSVWNLLQSSLCCPWRPRPLPTFLEQSCSLPSSSSLELSSRWSFSLPSCFSSRTSSWEGPCWLKREGIDEIEGTTSCKRAGAPKSRNMRDQSAITSWYTMPVCFTSFSQHDVARRVARCCTTCRISTYHLISCLSRNKTSLSCETTNFLFKKTMQTYMFHLVWSGRISFESHLGDFTAERAAGMTKL